MYYVSFLANEKPAGCMCVKEDMMFAELATKFCENYGLKEDNKPTFYFNSQEIKSESTRTLKEHGIVQMSVIQVKTPNDFNIPAYNANTGNNAGNMGNFQMNNSQFMGNYVNPGYYGYYQKMNPAFYPGMNPMYYQNMIMNQFPTNPNAGNGEFLNITFYYKGAPIQIQSTSNVRFCDLYTNKFIVKAGSPQKPPSFYLNNNRIDSTETKTLKN